MRKKLFYLFLIPLLSVVSCSNDDNDDIVDVSQQMTWLTSQTNSMWVDYENKHTIEGSSNSYWYEVFSFKSDGTISYIEKKGEQFITLDLGTYAILDSDKIEITLSESSYWKSGTYKFIMTKKDHFFLGGRKFNK